MGAAEANPRANLPKLSEKLVVVHLTDSFCLTQPSLYVSNLILALRAMLQMDLPHVNVLSKIDLVHTYGRLDFDLDYYTEVQDLSYLLPSLENEGPRALRTEKWAGLNRAVANLVESFSLVRFEVLAVENRRSMMHLLRVLDRANGYVFGAAEGANDTVWQITMRNEANMGEEVDVQERWIDSKDLYDEIERKEWETANKLHEAAEQEAQDTAEGPAAGSGGDFDEDFGSLVVPQTDSGVKVVRRKRP